MSARVHSCAERLDKREAADYRTCAGSPGVISSFHSPSRGFLGLPGFHHRTQLRDDADSGSAKQQFATAVNNRTLCPVSFRERPVIRFSERENHGEPKDRRPISRMRNVATIHQKFRAVSKLELRVDRCNLVARRGSRGLVEEQSRWQGETGGRRGKEQGKPDCRRLCVDAVGSTAELQPSVGSLLTFRAEQTW